MASENTISHYKNYQDNKNIFTVSENSETSDGIKSGEIGGKLGGENAEHVVEADGICLGGICIGPQIGYRCMPYSKDIPPPSIFCFSKLQVPKN